MIRRQETLQLLKVINDNEEDHVFTEEDWIVKTVDSILDNSIIDTINMYGKQESGPLKEDISSLGTEVVIDVDNNFTSARTSKIELYAMSEEQYLDFEVTNLVSFSYREKPIDIIKDEKETDEVLFNEDSPLIILKTDFIYTSDRGLDTKKILDVYIPFNLREVKDEEADY